MKRIAVFALLLASALLPQLSAARAHDVEQRSDRPTAEAILGLISRETSAGADGQPRLRSDADIIAAVRSAHLSIEDAAALWAFIADEDNAHVRTPAVVEALIVASDSPRARETMWSELSGAIGGVARHHRSRKREPSILAFFERHRALLRPHLVTERETEPSCDAIIALMVSSRIFGPDLGESVAYVSDRIPAAVARTIEHEHGLGRQPYWEDTAVNSMMRWKNARFLPRAALAPRSLAEFDAHGKTLISMFNSLQALNKRVRDEGLRNLGPATVFSAVVAGEQDLYRVGTSGYQDVLHAAIMAGIRDAGSFETFAEQALLAQFKDEALPAGNRRKMSFLRLASHFGLLAPVLETIRDRDRFVDDLMASLGDTQMFEGNSRVLMDVLTARRGTPLAATLKSALLDRLYGRYRVAQTAATRNAYGSLLSVYQTLVGDHRDASIDHEFALDKAAFDIPFARLFSVEPNGGLVHRMFMRMDSDDDAQSTYAVFCALMRSLNASVRQERTYDVFELVGDGRRIEIFANKPSTLGVKTGILDIARALDGRRVETVIGRGHTAIIERLQDDAKRILGDRITGVASIIVGSCGGDGTVRDLISTFGYKPFFTTRSTGRQVINNAVIQSYIVALMALSPADRLSIASVLQSATSRFMGSGTDAELRADASLYQVNMATVFTAQLYDTFVRQDRGPDQRAALE